MQSEPTPNRNSSPVAFSAVAILVVACVGSAVFLIPSEGDLFGRLTSDGKIERIREIVGQKIGHGPTSSELLRHGVEMLGEDGWDESDTQALEQLAEEIDDVGDGFATFGELADAIPTEAAGTVAHRLAERALGENRPELAAEILKDISKRTGGSAELTSTIVHALRASSKPGEGLAVLAQFKEKNGGRLPDHLAGLFDKLALESGDVDTLLAAALERFENCPASPAGERRSALDQLIAAATSAGRSDEVIASCEEFIASTRAGGMTWLEIIDERDADPGFGDPDFEDVAAKIATFYRWNNQPDAAFDTYRKLAALGSQEAIDDCVDLHLPLLRESEMATMLDAFIPLDGRPEYTLLAAKIHAKRTDYEIADGLYRQHLSSHPDDAASWAELGGMWDACSDLEQALEAYRKGSAANPDDDSLHKRIARTLVSLGRFEEALDYYGEMARYDRKDLTQYLTLATNLGDSVSTNDALRKWFTLPGDRRSIDYLRLARSYGALGQYDQMVTVYERAIDAFPNERGIRIELAGELSRMRRHSDVMRVLASPELREDPEAVSLHLSAAVASKQFKSGLAFSGNNAESRMALPISAKLPLAEIYYQTGSVSKSTRLYSSIPKSELPTLTRATLAFRGGRLAESESLLRRHLASNSKDHRSWSFLASVYQAQRKKPEARDAYQRALDLLKLDMKRR